MDYQDEFEEEFPEEVDESYHDDPLVIEKKDHSRLIRGFGAFLILIVSASYYLSTSIGGRITLNSGANPIIFGQGSSKTVACSGDNSLNITPISDFINTPGATGSHKFSSIKVTGIPTTCRGQDLVFSAYNNEDNSAAINIFNTTKSRVVVYMEDDDTFLKGTGGTGLIVTTNSSSSFTVQFQSPVAESSGIFNLTVQSELHTSCWVNYECVLGDTGPGGGKIFYITPSSRFACGVFLSETCFYLEAAPNTWSGTTSDPLKAWSTTTIGEPVALRAIGSGYKNSNNISGQDSTTAHYSARNYFGGANQDWYVPSYSELEQLYLQRTLIGGFQTTGCYWTSTQRDSGQNRHLYAWQQGFGKSSWGVGLYGKTQSCYVRPIRAF
jgi:hypothetical protein